MNTPTNSAGQESLFENSPLKKDQLPKKETEGWIFDALDALQAPILTFSSHWKDTIPKRLLDIIPMARMMAVLKKEELATLEECFAYIYTRTLEAPLHYEWSEIYNYVGYKTMQRWFKENHLEQMKEPKELSKWLQTQLDDLRRHLYKRRREILKERLRGKTK